MADGRDLIDAYRGYAEAQYGDAQATFDLLAAQARLEQVTGRVPPPRAELPDALSASGGDQRDGESTSRSIAELTERLHLCPHEVGLGPPVEQDEVRVVGLAPGSSSRPRR